MTNNFISTHAVRIAENRQRRAFNPVLLQELSDSITRTGLLHPIVLRVVGEDYQLVAGERRLRTISDLHALGVRFNFCGEPVPAGMIPFTSLGELSSLKAMEAELEENTQRTDLSWQEKATATAALMDLRAAQAEESGASAPTVADIAVEIRGSSFGDYGNDTRKEIILAKHINNPLIQKARNLSDAFQILKKEEQRTKNEEIGKAIGANYRKSDFILQNTDCFSWMIKQSSEVFDVILTDPPYGMRADEFGDSNQPGLSHTYDDSPELLQTILDECPEEFYRLAKSEAHAYIFCDFEKFPFWKMRMEEAGWKVFRTPLIWHKPDGFRAPWINAGPQRQYETVLFASKGNKPVTQMKGDVITCPRGSYAGYAAAKPVPLLRDLLLRSVIPGSKILDPFCGSGAIFPAAFEAKCFATGIEINSGAYALAMKRIEALA